MESKLKGVVGESSIVLHYQGEAITIQANTDRLLFEEFKDLIKNNNQKELLDKFIDIKARIEKYTDKNFYVKNSMLYLKGDEIPIPKSISQKLLELEASKEDFMPLIRFWKKLKTNPSEVAREHLYGFILHSNIPITEMGDIITEKGVKQRSGANVGELVDDRTGNVDNSIGMEVFMDRSKVDDNPNQTCSHGLHVGAPDYVRNHYSNKIIVQCIVNPRDVVAIPSDYNNTKMRVCRYVVAGYSSNAKYKPVYTLSDFITVPTEEVVEKMKTLSSSEKVKVKKDPAVKSVKVKTASKVNKVKPNKLLNKYTDKFNSMSGKAVIKFVQEKFGVLLPHNPKSKSSIVKSAAKIASNSEEISKS